MRRFCLFAVALITISSWAAHPLNVASRLMLSGKGSSGPHRLSIPKNTLYQAFIAIDDNSRIIELQECGVQVDGIFNGFVSARIPAEGLQDVLNADGITSVSLAQPLHWCNDSALYYSGVPAVHSFGGDIGLLTGRGVIIGVIDTGIDFNHINLCDDSGNSRVRAVYLPADTIGPHPVVDGLELPGACYETPQQIKALTADCSDSSHGTHTTGTAAGSFIDNGWNGVAPEADIVACGMPSSELTDVNIANAVKYIFDYADRVGKPCVINMSLGSNNGPNDGSSFLCRVFASLSGQGRLCVLSAGNDGDAPICFRYRMKYSGDTATTFLRNQWGGMQRKGYVSMWSNDQREHRTRMVILNRTTGQLEYASPALGKMPEDSVFTISSENDPDFAAFYTGEISFAGGLEPQYDEHGDLLGEGRYHSYWVYDVESVKLGHLIGLQYVADAGTELVGWCTKDAYFYSFNMPEANGGSSSGSISDLATTDGVISVGAYCSRNCYTTQSGDLVSFNEFSPSEIAAFSSYGPDENGLQRPDVCAPGAILISSANRYDVNSNRQNWPSPAVVNGECYPYYPNQGTSMSAPIVTGAIALMLQVNPALTTAQVREVLKRSSIKDDIVLSGNEAQWGAGKLDVLAAVNDVIQNTMLRGDVNNDGEINIADVLAIIDIIIGNSSSHSTTRLVRADVDQNREINVSDINRVIDLILNE